MILETFYYEGDYFLKSPGTRELYFSTDNSIEKLWNTK